VNNTTQIFRLLKIKNKKEKERKKRKEEKSGMLESKDIIFKLGLEKEEYSKRKHKLRSSPNTVTIKKFQVKE